MCPILNLLNSYCQLIGHAVAGKPIKKAEKMLCQTEVNFNLNTINVTGRTEYLLTLPHLILELQFEWQIIMLYMNFSWFRGTYRNISTSLDFFMCSSSASSASHFIFSLPWMISLIFTSWASWVLLYEQTADDLFPVFFSN